MMKLCAGGCGSRIAMNKTRCNQCQKARREQREREGRTGQNGVRRDQRVAKAVKARDRFRCVECRAPEEQKALEVHHKDGNPRNNALDNLETRCGTCHDQADAQLREQRRFHQPATWREAREAI